MRDGTKSGKREARRDPAGGRPRPARVVPPGAVLRRELEARGWTQADLAMILGRPVQLVSEVVSGKKRITPETALGLAHALGTSPEFWLNLEANYRVRLADRGDQGAAVRRRSRIHSLVPVRELIRRGWIEEPRTDEELEANVLGFLRVPSLDALPGLRVAARRTVTREPDTRALLAWTRRVEGLATAQRVPAYRREFLERAIARLLALTAEPRRAVEVPGILKDAGVRFVIVPHLQRTYFDGAVYAEDGNPTVALTLRHDRLDSFWFTLLHELAHLILGHRGKRLEDLESEAGPDPEEREADRWASERLVPEAALRRFVEDVRPDFSKAAIVRFARTIDRHPAIVIGRLQHDGYVPHSHLRSSIPRVRTILEPWIDGSEPSAYPVETAGLTVSEPPPPPAPEEAILRWLRDNPGWHAPAELKASLHLDRSTWARAIRTLLEAGAVERAGQKRGTRYRVRGTP